jgi:hypothetical protein
VSIEKIIADTAGRIEVETAAALLHRGLTLEGRVEWNAAAEKHFATASLREKAASLARMRETIASRKRFIRLINGSISVMWRRARGCSKRFPPGRWS